MKRPARTGTSVSSNVLTMACVSYDQMYTWPATQVRLVVWERLLKEHTAVEGCEDLCLVSQQCLEALLWETHPWLGGMKVDALDSLGAGKELSLYIKMRVSHVHTGCVDRWRLF